MGQIGGGERKRKQELEMESLGRAKQEAMRNLQPDFPAVQKGNNRSGYKRKTAIGPIPVSELHQGKGMLEKEKTKIQF